MVVVVVSVLVLIKSLVAVNKSTDIMITYTINVRSAGGHYSSSSSSSSIV